MSATGIGTSADLPTAAAVDGPSMGTPSAAAIPEDDRLPYPGLRPFRPDEIEIFFGREAALDAMTERLGQTKFLAVLGPSGCGKSSLVRTGLYTTLRLGLLPNAGGRWRIAEASPGALPIRSLACAVLKARADRPADWEPPAEELDQIEEHLRRGPRAIIELAEDAMLDRGRNVLLVIDQFEELFRFRDYAGREDAEAFVALLLESASSPLPIHVVITMRSEYLGACSLIPGLAERISDGMFLTPRMTREECRQAIEGPTEPRSFDIEPALVARILNDLQSFAPFDRSEGINQAEQLALQADQLPLMQHLLNRIWRQGETHGEAGRPLLTLNDYDEAGGLTGALDAHGAEIIDALEAGSPGITKTVERVFRALVDGPSASLAVRSPKRLEQLVLAAGGEDMRPEVERVIDAFRGQDCNFLRTSERHLDDRVIVDIGHESLIRRWTLLRSWFNAEVETRRMWRRLCQDADLQSRRRGDLLRDLDLLRVSEWWSSEQPSPGTVARYGGDYELVDSFIQKSRDEAEKRTRVERRTRLLLRVGAGVIVFGVLIASIVFLVISARHKQEAAQLRQQANEAAQIASRAAQDNLAYEYYFSQTFCAGYAEGTQPYRDCLARAVRTTLELYQERHPNTELGNGGQGIDEPPR